MWTFQHALIVNKTNIQIHAHWKSGILINSWKNKLVSSALKQMLDMSMTPLLFSFSPQNKVPGVFFILKSPESSNIDLGMKVFYDWKLFIA